MLSALCSGMYGGDKNLNSLLSPLQYHLYHSEIFELQIMENKIQICLNKKGAVYAPVSTKSSGRAVSGNA